MARENYGSVKNHILSVLKKSKKPISSNDLIDLSKGVTTKATLQSQLYRMVKSFEVDSNDAGYSLMPAEKKKRLETLLSFINENPVSNVYEIVENLKYGDGRHLGKFSSDLEILENTGHAIGLTYSHLKKLRKTVHGTTKNNKDDEGATAKKEKENLADLMDNPSTNKKVWQKNKALLIIGTKTIKDNRDSWSFLPKLFTFKAPFELSDGTIQNLTNLYKHLDDIRDFVDLSKYTDDEYFDNLLVNRHERKTKTSYRPLSIGEALKTVKLPPWIIKEMAKKNKIPLVSNSQARKADAFVEVFEKAKPSYKIKISGTVHNLPYRNPTLKEVLEVAKGNHNMVRYGQEVLNSIKLETEKDFGFIRKDRAAYADNIVSQISTLLEERYDEKNNNEVPLIPTYLLDEMGLKSNQTKKKYVALFKELNIPLFLSSLTDRKQNNDVALLELLQANNGEMPRDKLIDAFDGKVGSLDGGVKKLKQLLVKGKPVLVSTSHGGFQGKANYKLNVDFDDARMAVAERIHNSMWDRGKK